MFIVPVSLRYESKTSIGQASAYLKHPLPHPLLTLSHRHARPSLQLLSLAIVLLMVLSGHSIIPSAHSLKCGNAPSSADVSLTEGCAA